MIAPLFLGARIGVTRQGIDDVSAFTSAVFDQALEGMQGTGATLVDLDDARSRRNAYPLARRKKSTLRRTMHPHLHQHCL